MFVCKCKAMTQNQHGYSQSYRCCGLDDGCSCTGLCHSPVLCDKPRRPMIPSPLRGVLWRTLKPHSVMEWPIKCALDVSGITPEPSIRSLQIFLRGCHCVLGTTNPLVDPVHAIEAKVLRPRLCSHPDMWLRIVPAPELLEPVLVVVNLLDCLHVEWSLMAT